MACYNQRNTFQMDSPSGASLSALGCYLLTSLLFVFCAIAEFAGVLFLKQNFGWKKPAINDTILNGTSFKDSMQPNTANSPNGSSKITPSNIKKLDLKVFGSKTVGLSSFLVCTTKIDHFAFVFFNLSYLIFNCIYWANYFQTWDRRQKLLFYV